MFHQEIENSQVVKRQYLWVSKTNALFNRLPNPETLNSFVEDIMDPFKDIKEKHKLVDKFGNMINWGNNDKDDDEDKGYSYLNKYNNKLNRTKSRNGSGSGKWFW
jgi:hypothetical protein